MKKNKKRLTHEGANPITHNNNTTKVAVLSMLTKEPQDRYKLARALGISERAFRRIVHELRMDGEPIISDSRTGGYRLGTKKEAVRMANEMRSRAYDLLRTANRMEGIDPDQITIGELLQ